VNDLREKGYQYWALGHIHQPGEVCRDPWIVFAGNCQGRHARECGPRGCRLVTVNDSLEVESAEHRALDVARWETLVIDLAGAADEAEALSRTRAAMSGAVHGAEGRLVAARIILTGLTSLDGPLRRHPEHWRAELAAQAQDLGADAIWIEKIKVETRPERDLARLADRDALTRIALETLAQAETSPASLPKDIQEMLGVLPSEIRAELEEEWAGPGRLSALEDVRAIILDSLGTTSKGAE
jgi:DNA repair exonuclease SbcCD nuclease subunit